MQLGPIFYRLTCTLSYRISASGASPWQSPPGEGWRIFLRHARVLQEILLVQAECPAVHLLVNQDVSRP